MSKLPPEDPESIRLMIQSIIDDPTARSLLVKVECGCGDIRYRGDFCPLCSKCQMGCCMCPTPSELRDLVAADKKHVDELQRRNSELVETNRLLYADIDKRRDDFMPNVWDSRGVCTPCKKCNGFGVRTYASTSLWRGGIGGSAMSKGVCDGCWGSGDANYSWLNLREVESELRKLKEEIAHLCGENTGMGG